MNKKTKSAKPRAARKAPLSPRGEAVHLPLTDADGVVEELRREIMQSKATLVEWSEFDSTTSARWNSASFAIRPDMTRERAKQIALDVYLYGEDLQPVRETISNHEYAFDCSLMLVMDPTAAGIINHVRRNRGRIIEAFERIFGDPHIIRLGTFSKRNGLDLYVGATAERCRHFIELIGEKVPSATLEAESFSGAFADFFKRCETNSGGAENKTLEEEFLQLRNLLADLLEAVESTVEGKLPKATEDKLKREFFLELKSRCSAKTYRKEEYVRQMLEEPRFRCWPSTDPAKVLESMKKWRADYNNRHPKNKLPNIIHTVERSPRKR